MEAVVLDGRFSSEQPLSGLVATWLLMIPLFFFACRGILWFQGAEGNSLQATGFNSTAAAKGAGTALVLVSVFSCVLLLLLTRLYSVLRMCWENKSFVILAVYSLISCAWSQFPRLTLQFGIYIILNVLFVYYLYSRFSPSAIMELFSAIGWIAVVGSIVFALALPQYGIDHRASTSGAWQGIFVYKQPCAIMCTFLLSVAFYLPAATFRAKVLRGLFVVLTIFLVAMTQARTGWVLLACLLAYVVVMRFVIAFDVKDRMRVIVLTAMSLATVAVGITLYYQQILLLMGKDATLTGRTEIWKMVMVSAFKRPLLGYGYRAFWNGLQGESAHLALAVGWSPTGAHNGYLDVWLNLGLVGVIMVLLTMVVAMRDAITCLRHEVTPRVQWYLSIVFLTVIVNSVEYTVMIPNYLAWIMYMLACVGLAREAKTIRAQARS